MNGNEAMDGVTSSYFKNMNVLYVEDDFLVASQTIKLLDSFFGKVLHCDNAEEAIDVYSSNLIDIIITDIELPGISGLELCSRIRESNQQIPILITTIHDDREKLREAVKLNLVDYLIKPVSISSIYKILLESLKKNTLNNVIINLNNDVSYNPLLGQIKSCDSDTPTPLSQKEIKLLNLLIEHQNKIVSKELIEDRLYSDAPLSDSSYKSLIFRLRKKIGKNTIHSISGIGIKLNIEKKQNVMQESIFYFNELKVLLVEDNSQNREAALMLLERMGVKADEAADGEEAIEMVRKKTYDLVFMDIQMPKLDGLSATKIIRDEGFVTLPIIAVSAYSSQAEYDNSLNAGMNDHLVKPYSISSLQNLLSNYFSDKIVKSVNIDFEKKTSWAKELSNIPGVVLHNDMSEYWLKKEDFLQRIKQFIQNAVDEYDSLRAKISAKEISNALSLLHKLKGSVKLYGADRLFEIIQELELALNENENADVSKLLSQLDSAISELTTSK